jgi:hypothetical protein
VVLKVLQWRYSCASGAITSTFLEYLHSLCLDFEFNFLSGGGIGGGGDIFRLPLGSGSSTTVPLLDGKRTMLHLIWSGVISKMTLASTGNNNRTIYAAAFVDNRGNQKVLHISNFADSESD